MLTLPQSNCSLLVRTDFASEMAWHRVSAMAEAESEEGFQAYIDPISDPAFDGATWSDLRDAALRSTDPAAVLFVADSSTLTSSDAPILVVDLLQYKLGSRMLSPFRCIPAELWGVDNNLNISNMDWEDFADNVGDDGVFRGF